MAAGTIESAVLHMRRGAETFQHSFGKAASTDAVFLLGSITKTMTAAACRGFGGLADFRLSDRAVKFLPEFSEGERKEITIEQLLTHTSGLPDQLPENNALRQKHASLAEFVQATVRTPLLFPPGTKYHYQSMGILLAAEIAQRVSKMPLPEFLAKEVFAPLGMKRSALGLGPFKLEETVRVQTEHAAPESGAGDPTAKEWDWNSPYWRNLAAPSVAPLLCSRATLSPPPAQLPASRCNKCSAKRFRGVPRRFKITPKGSAHAAASSFALGLQAFFKAAPDRYFEYGGSTSMLAADESHNRYHHRHPDFASQARCSGERRCLPSSIGTWSSAP